MNLHFQKLVFFQCLTILHKYHTLLAILKLYIGEDILVRSSLGLLRNGGYVVSPKEISSNINTNCFRTFFNGEQIKSPNVFLQDLHIYLCLPLYLPFLTTIPEEQ